ncbi:MAG: YigZ family protein [Tissierellales bacterium]|jgi:uncharacterized YigZ family protein|nr:YigZ family protein [Tissierellales bacterium]
MEAQYRTVLEEASDEIEIKKSRFIGYAKPIETEEEALEFIEHIKKKHRDATHNVPAYVVGENNKVQRCNDDGEPSGTAGVPMLEVLKKENLRNVVVVVTRYFGGVKLGVGGLVRAYTKGAKAGLEAAKIIEKVKLYAVKYKLDYSLLGKVDYEIEKGDILLARKNYSEVVEVVLLSKEDEIENLNKLMAEWTQGQFDYEVLDENYYNIVDNKVII